MEQNRLNECVNCGEAPAANRYHIYLATDEVVEATLCETCLEKFVTAEWVDVVI